MKTSLENTRTVISFLIVVSILACLFLFWIIYFNPIEKGSEIFPLVSFLPAVNAFLNSCSALCVCAGVYAIIRKNQIVHIRLMSAAFIFSSIFLVSYIIYHTFHGDTPFLGQGGIRPIYFFILISHILLSVIALPVILCTFYFALSGKLKWHKKIVRYTVPLWVYVSISGVLVYFMLKFYQ